MGYLWGGGKQWQLEQLLQSLVILSLEGKIIFPLKG